MILSTVLSRRSGRYRSGHDEGACYRLWVNIASEEVPAGACSFVVDGYEVKSATSGEFRFERSTAPAVGTGVTIADTEGVCVAFPVGCVVHPAKRMAPRIYKTIINALLQPYMALHALS